MALCFDFVEIVVLQKFVDVYGPYFSMTLQKRLFRLAGFSSSKAGFG